MSSISNRWYSHRGLPIAWPGGSTAAAEQNQQAATPMADGMTDKLAHLVRLAELRERDILTDAEFEAQKQKLLGI